MVNKQHRRHFLKVALISVMLLLLMSAILPIRAQDTPTDTPIPTDTFVPPTDTPIPTDTVVPPTDTPVPPTDTPIPTDTLVPPTDTPTDTPIAPTDTPTGQTTPEATATVTETATETATVNPPVFNFSGGASFEVAAGVGLNFSFSVSDDLGAVTVAADTTGANGIVGVTTTAPIETAAPFNTGVNVVYTAPVSFSGIDIFSLVATNAANVTTTMAVTVNVTPAAPTEEITPEITPTETPTETPTVETPTETPTETPPSAQISPPQGALPLRVMVPFVPSASQRAAGVRGGMDPVTAANRVMSSPNLDPARSFSPGPRMNLPLRGPSGTWKALAILVQFSDNVHSPSVDATSYDHLLFDNPGNSVSDFYYKASYHQLDIVALTLPSTLGWQSLPNDSTHSYSYYVDGQNCFGTYPRNCQKLTEDVVNLVNPFVDFSQYDNDGDGWVDTVFIIHAGPGAEFTGNANDIWSHSWQTVNAPLVDGKYVGSYTMEPEYWETPGDMTHGVFAHELGHVFGLPDLYDVDYTSNGIGDWSLMSGGSWNGFLGDSPANFDAWSRVFLGFATATTVSSLGPISLPNVDQNGAGAIYRLNTGHPGEYFLLENRQPVGTDSTLPGNGLLVWHVDDNLAGTSNTTECEQINVWLCGGSHFRVALVQADGQLNLEFGVNGGDTGDPFPGSSNNTVFTTNTSPNNGSYFFAGGTPLGLNNISASGSTMTLDIADAPPVNDLWPSAQAISTLPFATSESVNSATVSGTDPAMCVPSRSNTVWFSYTAPFTQIVNLTTQTSGYDTVLGVYIGSEGSLSQVACNNNTGLSLYSSLSFVANAGTAYSILVAKNGVPVVAPSILVLSATLRAPALAPVLVSPLNGAFTNDNTPLLTWNQVTGAANYEVQIANNATFVGPSQDVTTGGSLMYTSTLQADGLWFWRVRATNSTGNGPWAAARYFRVDTVPPAAPIQIAPADLLSTIARRPVFSWGLVAGATRYELKLDTVNPPLATVQLSAAVSYIPPSNLLLTTYSWEVRAIDAAGNASVWSPIRSVTILGSSTTTPMLNLYTTSTPTLYWTAVPNGAAFTVQGYEVQIDSSPAFTLPLNYDSGTVTPIPPGTNSVTTLALADGQYYWRVRAKVNGVWGAWSAPIGSFVIDA